MDEDSTPPASDHGREGAPEEGAQAIGAGLDQGLLGVPATLTPPARKRRIPAILAIAIGLVLLGGIATLGVVVFALRGSTENLDKIVPANVEIYATVNLNPALSQKLALHDLTQKFPALRDPASLRRHVEQIAADVLDTSNSGLSFTSDIEPWLGSQISVAGRVGHGGTFVLLIASKDDGAARTALAKIRTGPNGREERWTIQPHDGVDVNVGRSADGSTQDAYAYVDHTAILGSNPSLIDDIIDTTEGKSASLANSTSYTKTVAGLPSARLVLAYVNVPSIIQDIGSLGGTDTASSLLPGASVPQAYTGMGLALTAGSKGLTADLTVGVDSSKLTAAERASLAGSRAPDTVLTWVPPDVFGVLAGSSPGAGGGSTIEGALAAVPGLDASARKLGLTGPNGLLAHLTGDFGLEAGPALDSPVGGAVLVGVDDVAVVQSLLDRVAEAVRHQIVKSGLVRRVPPWRHQAYSGVRISSLPIRSAGFQGLMPAYAVTDGMVIIASSPQAVVSAMDAHASNTNVTSSANFREAVAQGGSTQGGLFYMNIEGMVQSFGTGMPPSDAANLQPLKAFIITGSSTTSAIRERWFLLIR